MPGLIAAIYLLLSLRVRVCAQGSLCMGCSALSVQLGAGLVQLRFDGMLMQEGMRVRLVPRYGAEPARRQKTPKQKKLLKTVRRTLLRALRDDPQARLFVSSRIGLGDAAQTAVTAGAVRALCLSAYEAFGGCAPMHVRVSPDFEGEGFTAYIRCIFSFQIGDIMLAALTGAARKTGREGFGWKSIPLRA